MSTLEEGLHIERSEFLATALSGIGQELMLDYMANTEASGELPLYPPASSTSPPSRYDAWGRAAKREPVMSGSSMSATLHPARRLLRLGRRPLRRLALPADGVINPPVVILGHGLGATREMGLDAFAERFAEAGIAALAFTYRHFGDSGGQPRQLLSIKRQLADWDAAIAHIKTRPTSTRADGRLGQLLRRRPRDHRRLAPPRARSQPFRSARSPTASPRPGRWAQWHDASFSRTWPATSSQQGTAG
jgi:hypothetical protein